MAAGLPLSQVTSLVILSYMEFLYTNGLTVTNISNHLAALRAMYIVYGLRTSAFQDQRLQYYIRSLKLNRPLRPRIKNVFDEHMLATIVGACDYFEHPLTYKALYLMAFSLFSECRTCYLILWPLLTPLGIWLWVTLFLLPLGL